MFYLLRSNRAFNRTTAHPLDSAVRIAHHEDDLAALHYRNKTRAVIFKRSLPAEVIADMQHYEQVIKSQPQYSTGITHRRAPAVKTTSSGNTYYDNSVMSDSLQTCPALLSDILHVAGIFRRAAGLRQFSSEEGLKIRECFMDISNEEGRKLALWDADPHIDNSPVDDDPRRMTCAYTADTRNMGTGWFPGTFSWAETRNIRYEYQTAPDPENVLKKYNCQTTDAGDLCFFHTAFEGDDKDSTNLSLLHRSPMPHTLKPRLCLLLPT